MIRTILIDDEKDARFILRDMLERNHATRVTVVAEADDVDSGMEAIQKHRPDLVFLDIRMPQGTGFELLEKLGTLDFEVIFITAYDQYAVKAFQFSAFGYLMKPVRISELSQVISRFENQQKLVKQDTEKRIKVLVENYGDDRTIRKIVISNMGGFSVVNIEDILRLEGDRNYTHFILSASERITTSKTLGEYEELLSEHGFFRIHQSTIVNLRHVKGYTKGDGGMVEMIDGKTFPLARNRKAAFVEKFIS